MALPSTLGFLSASNDCDQVSLSQLPPTLARMLRPFDTDGDGTLQHAELSKAEQYLLSMSKQVSMSKISFEAFPERHRAELYEMDTDGDGYLDATEILHAIKVLNKSKRQSKRTMLIALAVLAFSILLLLAMCGGMVVVINATKEVKVNDNNELLANHGSDGSSKIRVASADFDLVGGVLSSREAGTKVKVSQALFAHEISSANLTNIAEMEALTVTMETTTVHFKVYGGIRYADATSAEGWLVVLFTSAGDVLLDGRESHIPETLAYAFPDHHQRRSQLRSSHRRWPFPVFIPVGLFR